MTIKLEDADITLVDSNFYMHSTYSVSAIGCTRLDQFVKAQVMRFSHTLRTFNNPVYIFDGDSRTIVANAAVDNYKAGRDGKDDKRKYKVFNITRKIIQNLGGSYIREMDKEADFIIGALAKQYEKAGKTVIIATRDKDANQLISPNIGVYDPNDKIVRDKDYVLKKFGVSPKKFAFYQTLVGDSIDNVPGLVGCGPVNAVKLIERFGTFKNAVAELENSSMTLPRFEQLFKEQIPSLKNCYKMVKMGKLKGCPEIPAPNKRNDKKLKEICEKYDLDYDYVFGRSRF